jgi:hypothetical protein
LLSVADISSRTYAPVIVGLIFGFAITALVTWRGMAPDKTPPGSSTPLDRPGAMKRIALIYAPISLLSFVVAVIDGGAAFILVTGLNAVLGVLSLLAAWRSAKDDDRNPI